MDTHRGKELILPYELNREVERVEQQTMTIPHVIFHLMIDLLSKYRYLRNCFENT